MVSLRTLLYAGVIAAASLGALTGLARKTVLFDSYTTVTVRDGNGTKQLRVPLYNPIKVLPGNCTKFSRKVAYDLSGKEFPPGDAWDRKYIDTVVARLGTNDSLENLAEKGILREGMLVAVYNPHTSRPTQKDKLGFPADITHIVDFLGVTPEGDVVVAEQYGSQCGVRTENALRSHGLVPKYVLDVKKPEPLSE